ncbi:hypothetical protein AB0I84_15725 [Streptomyces spectabilis]|uniref:hypothetical protein n=1 Tax=Streptomyces spectabilis TaxID=68270 RepID=UPI0033C22CBD
MLHQLYELADSRSLPAEARGEDGAWKLRMRPRHRLQEPSRQLADRDDELDAACGTNRELMARLNRNPRDTAATHPTG